MCSASDSRSSFTSIRRALASLAPSPTQISSQFVQSLVEDLRTAVFVFWATRLAGSSLVPRVLRFVMLRLAGVDVLTPNIVDGVIFRNRHVTIGSQCFINTGVYLEGPIAIGSNCHIGPGVMLSATTHELVDGVASRKPSVRPIKIGDHCWIGMGALILPGVTIGDKSVIGAGAVVTHDCGGDMTYVGVPARPVR